MQARFNFFSSEGNLKKIISIIFDSIYENHITGNMHPEQPLRVVSIVNAIEEFLPENTFHFLKPRFATRSEVHMVHPKTYADLVEKEVDNCKLLQNICELSTGDVIISPQSYQVALLAAGGVLTGIDAVMNYDNNAFCIVRPPGHHACTNAGMGFCIFNNVAIGARYIQQVYKLKRILIVDWDVHHGNGTQEIFYNDPSVFYFSTHQAPLYPGTGLKDERGVGNIMNIPIEASSSSRLEVIEAFEKNLTNAMEAFKPEFILISAGFDAHYLDPLGGMNLTEKDFSYLTEIVKRIAERYAYGRIVSVLEGGYNLEALALSAAAHIEALSR